jgi:transmembrane sensor
MTRERSDIAARVRRRVREATQWYVEQESGRRLSAAKRRQWDRWSADPDNKTEYDELCLLRAQFRSLPRPPRPTEQELKEDSIQVADGPAAKSVGDTTVVKFPERARLRSKFNRASVSAGAAVLVFAGAVSIMIDYGYWPFRWHSELWQTYSTTPAQQRDFTLPDGSVVTLGGDTVLRARVPDRSRAVFLDRGEALFRVKRNAQQPFTVHAQNGTIEALGTVFDVRNYSNRVQVTVAEGQVEVVSRTSKVRDIPIVSTVDSWFSHAEKSASVRVKQGQRVSYRMDGSASEPQATDPGLASDWTRGFITYNGKPLREIIEDVQRYYSRPIVLDETVANLNYTGTFLQKSADGWLRSLQRISPVEVVDQGDNIVIRARSSPRQ